MPSKQRFPRLEVEITPDRWATAVAASSGSCLIADAIKDDYPQFTGVMVDAQTIRVTDRSAGQRYTYLTPQTAQALLLSFDQGWAEPEDHTVRLRTPIRVAVLTLARTRKAQRETRKAALVAKRTAGERLTRKETISLARLETEDARGYPERPHTVGPVTEVIESPRTVATVVGGRGIPRPKPEIHPNLLAGRNRLFGAKTAQPAKVFQDAVDDEVARRLAEMGGN